MLAMDRGKGDDAQDAQSSMPKHEAVYESGSLQHASPHSRQDLRPLLAREPLQAKDPEIERALRQQITQGLPKARRYFDPNRIEIHIPPVYDAAEIRAESGSVSSSFERGALEVSLAKPNDVILAARHNYTRLPNPTSLLGAGRIDPLTRYPIKVDYHDQHILDQCRFPTITSVLLDEDNRSLIRHTN